MDAAFAQNFAEEWEAAWNSHDLERILKHYADDVVFESPHIRERFGEGRDEVSGKDALRAYWGAGLERETNLHFTVDDFRVSVNTIVINYRSNKASGPVTEVLRFRDSLVVWGCGAYTQGSVSGT
jgi:ketosteroid isomerase-like protein